MKQKYENLGRNIDFGKIYRAIEESNKHLPFTKKEEKPSLTELQKKAELEESLSLMRDNLNKIGLICERRQDDPYMPKYFITLQDGKKFIEYLKIFENKQASDDEKDGFIIFIDTTVKNLIYRYKLGEDIDTNAILELRESFEEILGRIENIRGTKRRDQKETNLFRLARSLIDPLQRGYLKEYLQLYVNGVFSETSGPDKWQYDISPELYRKRWDKVMEALDAMMQNPEGKDYAVGIYHKLAESLSLRIVNTESDLKSRKDDEKWIKYMNPIFVIMKDMKEVLNSKIATLQNHGK